MMGETSGKDLLSRLLSSETKGDLLTLFHRNPGLVDTLDGVGRRLGREGDKLREDLMDFVDLGLLRTSKAGKFILFSLDAKRDQEIQGELAKYLGGLKT